MEKDIFTLDDMKRLNIITTHYQKIQAPEIVTATLEMKAECTPGVCEMHPTCTPEKGKCTPPL